MSAKGIKPDVPELSAPVQQPAAPKAPGAGEAGSAVKTEVKTEIKEGAEVLTKEAGHVVEESGLKAGAKFVGKKAAKFTPILGVGVAIVLVAKDVHAVEGPPPGTPPKEFRWWAMVSACSI